MSSFPFPAPARIPISLLPRFRRLRFSMSGRQCILGQEELPVTSADYTIFQQVIFIFMNKFHKSIDTP